MGSSRRRRGWCTAVVRLHQRVVQDRAEALVAAAGEVDVIACAVWRLVRAPGEHRERAALERDGVEEAAALIAGGAALRGDDLGGAGAILDDAFGRGLRAIARADEQHRRVRD